MANNTWIGGATAVAQEDRFTPCGTIEINDKFILTLYNQAGSSITITASATGTTVAQVCADLLTAWNAALLDLTKAPYMSGITASNQTTYFKLLRSSADGIPFTAVPST